MDCYQSDSIPLFWIHAAIPHLMGPPTLFDQLKPVILFSRRAHESVCSSLFGVYTSLNLINP